MPARSVPSARMAARGAGPWLLLAAVLCAAAEPRCPSCAAGAERRLLEEAAKRQLLEKLRLRERPRLAHAVPRAAVARALRRLQAGGARRGPDDEEEEERGYEIISFAEPGACAAAGRDPPWSPTRPPRAGAPRGGSGEAGCARCRAAGEPGAAPAGPARGAGSHRSGWWGPARMCSP